MDAYTSHSLKIFFKKRMDTAPVICHTLEQYYHVNGNSFEK